MRIDYDQIDQSAGGSKSITVHCTKKIDRPKMTVPNVAMDSIEQRLGTL